MDPRDTEAASHPTPVSRVARDAVPGFLIGRELGRGGMGVVFEAAQQSLGRKVALKMVLDGDLASARQVERFRREARVVARLSHPHVVQVIDFGEADGRPWYAMEFCPGGSLADRLEAGPPPVPEAVALVATLADATESVHRHGVLHRDLKPDNVLFSADGLPKIADFGLVRDAEGAGTMTGAAVGTPSYMSPEQARGEKVDGRTDVYALGAILYECLTGRPPFRGPSAAVTLALVLMWKPPPRRPRELNGGVPAWLEAVCLRAMNPEAALRYRTAAEFAAALRGAGRAEDGRPARAAMPAAGAVLRVGAIAALGLAIAGVVAWALTGGGDRPAARQAPPADTSARPREGAVVREPRQTRPAGASPKSQEEAVVKEPPPLKVPFSPQAAGAAQKAWAAYLGRTVEEEIDLGGGVKMVQVLIPPGSFRMGSPEDERGREDDEEAREVKLTRPFYLGKYEVTRGQFRRLAEDGYESEAERYGNGYGGKEDKWEQKAGYSWKDAGWAQTDEHPAMNMSWDDARVMCEWLEKRCRKKVTLPTEAQWEWACRAGTRTAYSCGDSAEGLAAVANVADGTARKKFPGWTRAIDAEDGYVYTSPAGKFKANGFGLHDMHGNVWEWCLDWYGPYKGLSDEDPFRPLASKSRYGSARALRGGSWSGDPRSCRSANRSIGAPLERLDLIGFRVCLPVNW